VNVLKTRNILNGEKKCPSQNLSVCNQIIKLQKGATKNLIDKNEFDQGCSNSTLPSIKKNTNPPDHPTSDSDFDTQEVGESDSHKQVEEAKKEFGDIKKEIVKGKEKLKKLDTKTKVGIVIGVLVVIILLGYALYNNNRYR
jgi:hypothetical protein